MDPFLDDEQAQGPPDVVRLGLAATGGVHPAILDNSVGIDAGAGERQIERTCDRCLRPAGVGGSVVGGITSDCAKCGYH